MSTAASQSAQHTPGPTVAQLLEQAPAGQVARMRGVFAAIEQGRWVDASFALKNAAEETVEADREFALAASLLCSYCDDRAVIAKATGSAA